MISIQMIEEGNDRKKQLDSLHELDVHFRGSYLIGSNWIEFLISDIITIHSFPKDVSNRLILFSNIINNDKFSMKIKNLFELLEKDYPELYSKYSELQIKLNEIRKLRNKFAHSVIDNSDEFLARKQFDRILLRAYVDGGKQFYEVTNDDIKKELAFVTKVTMSLIEIQQHIQITKQVEYPKTMNEK
ncbi:MAG: hypothetical protein D4R72_01275 [Nitrosopumilales archaeon]|nr:MAG: hypothetical protein D4R72_01275 [Nitrosopumilales archaeon]